MSEITIRIGGKKIKLKESEKEFSVLTKNPDAIEKLKQRENVESVNEAAIGVQVVSASNSEERDELMDEIRSKGIAHHVYEVADTDNPQEFIITDKINIKFKENTSKEERENLLQSFHLQFRKELAPDLYSCQVTDETNMNPIKLCSKLDENEMIEYIEPDFVIENKLFDITDAVTTTSIQDKLLKDSWHLNEVDLPFVVKGSDIKGKGAWDMTRGNSEIIIAVMDDGFDLTNPDLKNKIKFPSDFTRLEAVSGDPSNMSPDDDLPLAETINGRRDYHGTPCAGLALASDGHGDVIGVAPRCSFMPVRWNIGKSTQDLILQIFSYISKRADVVSCSWGIKPQPIGRLSNTIHDTLNELAKTGGRRGKGLIICFAAGNDDLPTQLNEGENGEGLEYYKNGVASIQFKGMEINGGWTQISNVIVVSAITSRNKKSLYSNWGPHITVCAPSDNWHPIGVGTRKRYNSVNLVTTDNEIHGLGLLGAGLSELEEGFVTHGMGGTSGATPIVAGVCGLMLSVNPGLTAKRVKQILQETANKNDIDFQLDDNLFNNRNQDGHFKGTEQHSLWFGYGKVNAEAATMKALNENSGIIPLPAHEFRNQTEGGNGPLKRNDARKTLVKHLQRILKKLGFNLGNSGDDQDGIDGIYGDKTFDAVKNFQNTHNDLNGTPLKADGKVGKLTAEALNKAAGI